MRIFKTRLFAKWAYKMHLKDAYLKHAIKEIEEGLIDAYLGGQVYKKRIAIHGRGKSSGIRSLIAFKASDRAFFIFGYAKNEKDNMTYDEEKIVKALAKELLGYSFIQLDKLLLEGKLMEVNDEN